MVGTVVAAAAARVRPARHSSLRCGVRMVLSSTINPLDPINSKRKKRESEDSKNEIRTEGNG